MEWVAEVFPKSMAAILPNLTASVFDHFRASFENRLVNDTKNTLFDLIEAYKIVGDFASELRSVFLVGKTLLNILFCPSALP